jgi:phage/plasmid-associated DNA primase
MSDLVLYNIDTYNKANDKFIKKNAICVEDIEEMKKYLKSNLGYHFRIHKNTQYIFFGDIDNYSKDIKDFIIILQKFMLKRYNLNFSQEELKYTQNNEKKNSYHFSIPKWNLKTEKIKEIMINFSKEYEKELEQKESDKSCIDTTIYSEHWFRCPNQKKGQKPNDTSKHIIINGEIEDFVINFIPKESININDVVYIEEKKQEIILKKKEEKSLIVQDKKINKEMLFSSTLSQPSMYKKMFDECYNQRRFDEYESWMSVGMALKNSNLDDNTALELFNYFSSKGNNYDGFVEIEKKFRTFIKKKTQNKYTVATIYYYAIEDNKPRFIEIMNKNTFDLEQSDICKYLKMLAGKIFIYIGKKIYCFNGKIWKQDDILIKHFISNELYEFLKMILVELYFDHKDFNSMKSQIKKLKSTNFKKDVVETYREIGTNDEINLDNKWNLFGFNNLVYDLDEEIFREYKYDDYVSITTGYDWIEPSEEEINTLKKILHEIMPEQEEYNLYLQILSSTLDGKCLEKFIIFSGNGGNGKGVVDDLLLVALGNYGMIGNNSILFETNKTGSNPEKANIHKKRLVIFREPPESKKFENSIIKELTGGGTFSARGHHESDTKKDLNLTMIVECNKKPMFSEEPTNADVRRIIDLNFRSTYTTDDTIIDEKNNIYKANPYYKSIEFQQKYKYALIKILIEEHKKYKKNNFIINLPKSITERTQNYLDLSYSIVKWFKETYEHTKNKNDYIKIKDLYSDFTESIYFSSLTKNEKQKYNKKYFSNYIETNTFFRKYYVDRLDNVRSIVREWKKINEDDEK